MTATSATTSAATANPTGEATIGRTMLASVGWTTVAMFLFTGAPMWLLTGEIWNGIGLGSFCAFWGGPGFGTMVGGAIWTHRCERQAAAATKHSAVRDGQPTTTVRPHRSAAANDRCLQPAAI